MNGSPFLHRGAEEHRPTRAYVGGVDKLAFEKERGRVTLERLRYHWWVRRGTLGSFMQRFGDWGREHFPFIGRGWDGFGPNR